MRAEGCAEDIPGSGSGHPAEPDLAEHLAGGVAAEPGTAGHIWRGPVVIHVRCNSGRGTIGEVRATTMSEDNEHGL
jgi:hypothetical protein